MTGKRLFEVTYTFVGYVLAESEDDAIYNGDDIVRDGDNQRSGEAIEVGRFNGIEGGWSAGSLVYGSAEDVTLADAWPEGLPSADERRAYWSKP